MHILVTFYQWGHFVNTTCIMIRNLNFISIQSWTYLASDRFHWRERLWGPYVPHVATWTDEFPDPQNQDQQTPPIKIQSTTQTTSVVNAIKGPLGWKDSDCFRGELFAASCSTRKRMSEWNKKLTFLFTKGLHINRAYSLTRTHDHILQAYGVK